MYLQWVERLDITKIIVNKHQCGPFVSKQLCIKVLFYVLIIVCIDVFFIVCVNVLLHVLMHMHIILY